MTAAFLGDEYSQMVEALCKPGVDILTQLTPQQAHVWHMATGVSGEAGELLDAVKKWAIYQKKLDVANVVEELGDLEFYMEGLRHSLGISREYVLNENTKKLRTRYGDKYSNEAAAARVDKSEVVDA
jgi:NTP pyrophosphatase (non-canonical NTP hydrolase)